MAGSFRMQVVALACLVLAACGTSGSDHSEATVHHSPAVTAAPLLRASVIEAERFLPGLKVVKSRPSDRELRYAFPGDGKQDPATLLFRFEPVDDGKATKVQAWVTVPTIVMTMDGTRKVLSAAKVGAEVNRILAGMAKGNSTTQTASQMSAVLTALAIATDEKLRIKAMGLAQSPQLALRDFIEQARDDAQMAVADRNDPTEFQHPHDDSEEFAPEQDSYAQGGGDDAPAE